MRINDPCSSIYSFILLSPSSFSPPISPFFFFNDTATTEIYTLSLHDALPISDSRRTSRARLGTPGRCPLRPGVPRSEEHTSELQSPDHLVCRLLLEKKKNAFHYFFVPRHTNSYNCAITRYMLPVSQLSAHPDI